MTSEISLAFCTVLGVLAVFRSLLIIGLPFGRFAWGGQNPVLPVRHRVGSAVSVVVYAAFAVVALERAGLISILPAPFVAVVAMWVIAVYLLLSVLPDARPDPSGGSRMRWGSTAQPDPAQEVV